MADPPHDTEMADTRSSDKDPQGVTVEDAVSQRSPNSDFRVNSFVFLDLETSHLDSSDQPTIIELSLIAVHRSGLVHPDVLTSVRRARNDYGTIDLRKISMPRVADKLTLCLDPRKHTSPMTFTLTKLDNLNLTESRKMPFDDGMITMLKLFLARQESPVCLVAHHGNRFDFPLLKTELARLTTEQLLDNLLCVDSLEGFRADFASRPRATGDGRETRLPCLKRKAQGNGCTENTVPGKKEVSQYDNQKTFNLHDYSDVCLASCNGQGRMDFEPTTSANGKSNVIPRTQHCDVDSLPKPKMQDSPISQVSLSLTASSANTQASSVSLPPPSAISEPGAASISSAPNISTNPSVIMETLNPSTSPVADLSSMSCVKERASMECNSSSAVNAAQTGNLSAASDAAPTSHVEVATATISSYHASSSVTSAQTPLQHPIAVRASQTPPPNSNISIATGTSSQSSVITPSRPEAESRRTPPPPPTKSKNRHQISHSRERTTKVSFSLENIFKRTFGMPPVNAHAAEDDIVSLMQIILPRAEEFVFWADENATEFKDVGFYYKPLNFRRKLQF